VDSFQNCKKKTYRFYKIRKITWIPEYTLASQKLTLLHGVTKYECTSSCLRHIQNTKNICCKVHPTCDCSRKLPLGGSENQLKPRRRNVSLYNFKTRWHTHITATAHQSAPTVTTVTALYYLRYCQQSFVSSCFRHNLITDHKKLIFNLDWPPFCTKYMTPYLADVNLFINPLAY
jgi:hypothetical protein